MLVHPGCSARHHMCSLRVAGWRLLAGWQIGRLAQGQMGSAAAAMQAYTCRQELMWHLSESVDKTLTASFIVNPVCNATLPPLFQCWQCSPCSACCSAAVHFCPWKWNCSFLLVHKRCDLICIVCYQGPDLYAVHLGICSGWHGLQFGPVTSAPLAKCVLSPGRLLNGAVSSASVMVELARSDDSNFESHALVCLWAWLLAISTVPLPAC